METKEEAFRACATAVRDVIALDGYRDAGPEEIDEAARNLRTAWLAFLSLPEMASLFGDLITEAHKAIKDDDAKCPNCATVDCDSPECEDA